MVTKWGHGATCTATGNKRQCTDAAGVSPNERTVEKLKLNLRLVPGFFLEALAVPFMLGAAKYEEGNWRSHNCVDFPKARTDSMLRHTVQYLNGEDFDEDGQSNLAAIAWNALVVLWYRRHNFINPFYADVYEQRLKEYQDAKANRNATTGG
jgi:Domain of unknown function (DUF5664)